MTSRGLHRYALVLAVCTLILVVAGASVVSKEAGLSVPDWPLSYGQVMPEMKDGVAYEHGHRMIATLVGLLTIGLVIWVWRSREPSWLRSLAVAALAAVILQGVLGGLTVLYLLPKAVSIAHACLAQLFFSTTVAIALFTSPDWKRGPNIVVDNGKPSLRFMSIAMAAATFAQIVLGAAYRHKAIGILPHVCWAFAVAIVIMLVGTFILSQFRGHSTLRRTAAWMMSLMGIQLILGIAAYAARVMTADQAAPQSGMVLLTVAHTAMGAIIMASTVLTTLHVVRNVRTAGAPAHHPEAISLRRAS